ncbi:hypothetical protein [Aestuariivirga sp.]|uniref:hypothetical protein n=1 Tax=Aestuariivirga sp. TaxID=2650926 RepID=UPI0035B335A6
MNRPLVLLLVTGLAFGANFPLGKLAVAAGVNPALWAAVICLGAGLAVGVATSASVWLHGDAATRHGPRGLTAETLLREV